MRERLIELLRNAPRTNVVYGNIKLDKPAQTLQTIADHLLANGVIVPPCKVGDSCYPLPTSRKPIVERKISRITFSKRNIILGYYENDGQYRPPLRTSVLGEGVFLSKEEAEKALRGDNDAE